MQIERDDLGGACISVEVGSDMLFFLLDHRVQREE
jgi:hypothetical protein